MEDTHHHNTQKMRLLGAMLNSSALLEANAADTMNTLNQLIAERTQILTRILAPRQELTIKQARNLDYDNTRFNHLDLEIEKLRKRRAGLLEQVTNIETTFRSNIVNAPFIEVDSVAGARHMTGLYDGLMWEGTLCINQNLDIHLRDAILANSIGLPYRLFNWQNGVLVFLPPQQQQLQQ
ncbi:hypothetical protein POM88_019312 [Heracleum sosnowskyi]|uniref:Uncharacterized protein n=1 Tax=Heracleum sosnowskyi TaxID=360622 RepID=A0AAD8IS37_9APIA|nr:hypothetical protein POM88_019312 [Heracleum sosnowskyi]